MKFPQKVIMKICESCDLSAFLVWIWNDNEISNEILLNANKLAQKLKKKFKFKANWEGREIGVCKLQAAACFDLERRQREQHVCM